MSFHPHPSRSEILAESESHLQKLAPAPLPLAQRRSRPPALDAAATNLAVPVVVQGADQAAVATFRQLWSCNPGDAPVEGSPTRLTSAPCEAARAGMPTAPSLSGDLIVDEIIAG